jgi:hypothetical protein
MHRHRQTGDPKMAPRQEGVKSCGKGLVIHPAFAMTGDYSPRQQKGCEVKRKTLNPVGRSEKRRWAG